MAHSTRRLAEYVPDSYFSLTLVRPATGSTVTNAAVRVEWLLSTPGTQLTYRIEVFSDAPGTVLVYDSGVVASAGNLANIPVGVLESGTTYYVRVTAADNLGAVGNSTLTSFTTSWTGTAVTGLAATIHGDACGDQTELPGIALRWTAVTPAASETFIRYGIWRRQAGQTAWTLMVEESAINSVAWTDYDVEPRVAYEYAVTATYSSGTDTVTSSRTATATATVDFEFAYLHDPDNPANFAWLPSWDVQVAVTQDVVATQRWGSALPRLSVGDQENRTVTINGHPELLRVLARWTELRALQSAQRTSGAVICCRIGRSGEYLYCGLTGLSRRDTQMLSATTIQLTEVAREVGIGL